MLTDPSLLAKHSVLIYNTNAAFSGESERVARSYASQYGIPGSNMIGFDMGADTATWAFPSGAGTLTERSNARCLSFFKPLYDLVSAVQARAVFLCYGCPVMMRLLRDDAADANGFYSLIHIVSLIKRIGQRNSGEPRTTATGGLLDPADPTKSLNLLLGNKGGLTPLDSGGRLIQQITDADFGTTRYVLRDRQPDFSLSDCLPAGFVGYTAMEGAPETGGYARSLAIIGKSLNTQTNVALAAGSKVLVAVRHLAAPDAGVAQQLQIAKRFKDLGFDTTVWMYQDYSAINPAHDTLVDYATTLGATGTNWTDADLLDAGKVQANPASVTYTYGIGSGFWNDQQVAWKDKWIANPSGAYFAGGASYGDRWGVQIMKDADASSFFHIEAAQGGWHQGAGTQMAYANGWLHLLDGYSLAEAAWLGDECSFTAIGDPLARPIQRLNQWWDK